MQQAPEPPRPEVGSFDVTVSSAGRHGRQRSSHFKVRCDAIGLDGDEILLLSVVGPETSVKALTAGLRSSGQDQQRIEYAARVGGINQARLVPCPDGYRVYRAKLAYGLWHVLCLARRDGFLPVLTEATLWQQLRGEPFTTPLLREWMPWLYRALKERGLLTELTQSGCQAGLLRADNDALDALVVEGVQKGHLAIDGRTARQVGRVEATKGPDIQDLDQYLLAYGPLLGRQAERALQPLHVPGRDACPDPGLLREPFEAQAHAIEATRKALARQKALLLVGEMGTGKTLMALAACHAHAAGQPYRGQV